MYSAQNMEGTLRVFDANYTCPWAQNFSASVASSSNNSWDPKAVSSQNHQGLVTILLDKQYQGTCDVEVVDMQGHRILTDKISSNSGSASVDLSPLKSGLNFIRITGNGFTLNRKVVLK